MQSLLYVSERRVSAEDPEAEISDIVRSAIERNTAVGVTGALLFTRRYFAQVLEGEAEAVQQIMALIVEDPRHSNVTVVRRANIDKREFADWSMIHISATIYVERRIEALLASRSWAGEYELRHIMVELAKP